MPLSSQQQTKLCRLNQAASIHHSELIQSLWGGYGELLRVHFKPSARPSVIVKNITYPEQAQHPRGWNSSRSHQRKAQSYWVERAWYQNYAHHCDEYCYVPKLLAAEYNKDQQSLILEDLHTQGFCSVKQQINLEQALRCIRWLAYFHARFIQSPGERLWPQGGYWHLSTRPDELAAMPQQTLKSYAKAIDQYLHSSAYHCVIHGDAKLANFCFNEQANTVAAVDFQYVGRGCGMQDVALFMGSCLNEQQCFEQQEYILDDYFTTLKQALLHYGNTIREFAELEQQWRARYPFAWADFERFLKGWSPGHWKINRYSQQQTQYALNALGSK